MDRLFNTKTGKVILSVIWGLGIAALFYKVCQHAGCFVVREPSNPQIEKSIYEFKNECFGGGCSPTYPELPEQTYPPKCKQPLFDRHPPIDFYEHRMAENCGDKRHYREPSCYKFHPMDTVFRAPSSQIIYPYH